MLCVRYVACHGLGDRKRLVRRPIVGDQDFERPICLREERAQRALDERGVFEALQPVGNERLSAWPGLARPGNLVHGGLPAFHVAQ